MDLKNIIAAIALSAAVIVLYGLFLLHPKNNFRNLNKIQQNEIAKMNDIPSIDEKIEVKTISRDDALIQAREFYLKMNLLKVQYL